MIEGISLSTAFGGHLAGLLLEAEKAAAGPAVPVLARCAWSMAGCPSERDNATAKAPCNSLSLSLSPQVRRDQAGTSRLDHGGRLGQPYAFSAQVEGGAAQ
jgi:hypothetical protein